jgi:hypothetical protein
MSAATPMPEMLQRIIAKCLIIKLSQFLAGKIKRRAGWVFCGD